MFDVTAANVIFEIWMLINFMELKFPSVYVYNKIKLEINFLKDKYIGCEHWVWCEYDF